MNTNAATIPFIPSLLHALLNMEGAGFGGELLSLLVKGVGEFSVSAPEPLFVLEDSGQDSKLILVLLWLLPLSCNSGAGDAIGGALFTKSTKLSTSQIRLQHLGFELDPLLDFISL